MKRFVFVLIGFLSMFFAQAQRLTLEFGSNDPFENDSIPVFAPGTIMLNQPENLPAIIDRHILLNGEREALEGWRVQVFFESGPDARVEAERIKYSLERRFAEKDIGIYRTYHNPWFSVRLGDFRTKRDAERLLKKISEEYPSAWVVKDKIDLSNE